jgi:protocatechuate 3,4-dioxygenase beta subunit
VKKALLDFWHADSNGDYDNDGFRCRGHQYTDAEGRYRLETVVPGLYPGRTRHFHVKVQAPAGRLLTTQLYFPREPRNSEDPLFRAELLMRVKSGVQRRDARFDFVVEGSSRS